MTTFEKSEANRATTTANDNSKAKKPFLRKLNDYTTKGALALSLAATVWTSGCRGLVHVPETQTQNFQLTENANPPQGGSISPGSATYPAGQQVQLSETPNAGYQFQNWSCTGWNCYSGPNPTPTIMMNNNMTEVANFVPASQWEALTINNNGCTSVSGSGTFAYGSTVPISADVPANNTFNWSSNSPGGYNGTNNPASLTLNNAITETANCTPITSTVGSVYVLSEGSGTPYVSVISADQLATTLTLQGVSYSIISDGVSTVYVGLTGCSCGNQPAIQTINGNTNTLGDSFSANIVPNMLVFNSDSNGTALYVGTTTVLPPNANMEVYNPPNSSSSTIVNPVVPIEPTYISFSPNKLTAYISSDVSGTSEIAVMPTTTEEVSNTIPVQNTAYTTVNPAGTQLWASSLGIITVFDTSNDQVLSTITIPGTSSYQVGPVSFSSDGSTAYAGNANNLVAIDTNSFQVTAQIPGNTLSEYAQTTPNGQYVYYPTISSDNNNNLEISVNVVSTSSNTLATSIPLGTIQGPVRGFDQIMFSEDGTEAYISGGSTSAPVDNFYIIDVATMALKTSIQLPGEEQGMTEIPNNGTVSEILRK